jgi:mRNA interferase MazF
MELHRYDIIEAELDYGKGSIQKKKRPYIIVSNEKGNTNATIITVMPLTHIIKKKHLPTHSCLTAKSDNGLSSYSMILGEQPQTIEKEEVIRKLGTVIDQTQRNSVNKVCFNTFFFGENINWEEVLA